MNWIIPDEYIIGTTKHFKLSKNIAAFDLDDTIISTKTGKKFANTSDDWTYSFNTVSTRIKNIANTHSIIIISNQAGIQSGKTNANVWMKKIDNIINDLKLDAMILCASHKNKYRKPTPSFMEFFNPNKEMDKLSFYCGDACGRSGDFSDTDYKFALNCNMKFVTPEHFFCDKPNKVPSINPNILKILKNKECNIEIDDNTNVITVNALSKLQIINNEMIIMMGFPGSGKSYVSKYIEDTFGYVIINQDILKTKAKCKKSAIENMKFKKGIIIDATNSNNAIKQEWIDIAIIYKYSVVIIEMITTIEISKHNNFYRSFYFNKPLIPDIAYNIYKSKYEEPNFNDLVNVSKIIKIELDCPNDSRYFMYMS
jgi:bifunctional polynucleotide phosphatase/kinase